MIIRVGIDTPRRAVLQRASALRAPLLVSANSLWNEAKSTFTRRWQAYRGFDIALDSGGFVAMKLYGRYRWSVDQYVGLAQSMAPAWWAQMDFCCEPELASDSGGVARRIDMTAAHLHLCQDVAARRGVGRPMPVLQGWKPKDYCSGPAFDAPFDWPSLVGVGSVCRRHVYGRDGLMAVIHALDAALPPSVRLHLFGVKSGALSLLIRDFPDRIASVDSMAWSMAARWHTFQQGIPNHGVIKADFMEAWYRQQTVIASAKSDQPRLL